MAPLPWITRGERVVAKDSPLFADVANRPLRALLTESGYDPDASPFPGLMGPVFNVKAFGTFADTAATRAAFATAFAAVAAAGGGTVWVPRATYTFNIASDSDTLLLPSNCDMLCEPGTILRWGQLGSPLFAAVNKENINIVGPIFEWNGTLVDVAGGTAGRFGQSMNINNRDYCCHVLSLGSNNVRIVRSTSRTQGDAPTLATQAFVIFGGFYPSTDGTSNTGNGMEDCKIDDVIQGCLTINQHNFRFENIASRRFPGDNPIGGGVGTNGHLFYNSWSATPQRSQNITIRDITDFGVPFGTIDASRADTSIQAKAIDGGIITGVLSRRPTGLFSFDGTINCRITNSALIIPTATVGGQAGISCSTSFDGVGMADCTMEGITVILPDNTDRPALSVNGMQRCQISMYVSASHTTESIGSVTLNNSCIDNIVRVDYLARTINSVQPGKATTTSHRNQFYVNLVGQNHKVRPFAEDGCLDNVMQVRDNVIGKWTEKSWWVTEANSPAMGYESIKKSKVYRIGTSTNPTTTLQLPRAGVWVGTVQIIEASGAHLRGGFYRIVWDAGALQSVELLGTQWTVGASPPSVLNLAVSAAGVVTVTTTAPNAAWDIVYDFQSLGNNRYADY